VSWDIAGAPWISILQPCSPKVRIFLVYHEFDVLENLFGEYRQIKARESGTHTGNSERSVFIQRFLSLVEYSLWVAFRHVFELFDVPLGAPVRLNMDGGGRSPPAGYYAGSFGN
jgi:hypothetical protein